MNEHTQKLLDKSLDVLEALKLFYKSAKLMLLQEGLIIP